jgi:DNA-binding beta-propeller fold protein YncE
MVDPSTLEVIARAPVGPDPHEVIASSDGKTAYVSIYGGGRYHAISVIDLAGKKALPDIDTGPLKGPHGLAFVGAKLWFTAEGAKAIATYDPATAKVDWIMGTGQNRTHMIYVTPDEKQIYTTNVSSANRQHPGKGRPADGTSSGKAPAGRNADPHGLESDRDSSRQRRRGV